MDFSKKKNKSPLSGSLIGFIFLLICLCCMMIIILTTLRLPEASARNRIVQVYYNKKRSVVLKEEKLGKLGEIMVNMLPNDLAFTLFIPSEHSFERDLKLQPADCLGAEKVNDTYAILSRIMGFSTVPRSIYSVSVPYSKEINFDSISGYKLFVSKESGGNLIVNRVASKLVDIRRGELVVHIMDGAIMEAEFEQAFKDNED